MAKILKFPETKARFGFKKASKRTGTAGSADQINLFNQPVNRILSFPSQLSIFDEALLRDEQGDAEAEALYRKAITENDCPADAYCNLGILESQKGSTSKAFDCFTQALKLNARHLESHYNLANLYFDAGDLRLARVHYEMAAEVDPSFPNLYFNLGLVQAMSKDLTAAIASLTRYRELVGEEEASKADDLLSTLQKSLHANN
jgi:tetratricopeptide (TPR) repeat protein